MADASVFEVFDFPLRKGTLETVLGEAASVVLTQKMAERFFGDEDPIGKVLSVSDPYFEGDYQAFNVGSGIGTSIEHIALTLSNILNTSRPTSPEPIVRATPATALPTSRA